MSNTYRLRCALESLRLAHASEDCADNAHYSATVGDANYHARAASEYAYEAKLLMLYAADIAPLLAP